MMQYCADPGIALSRSCPLKKNDHCWVEQKNSTLVRRFIGYHRLGGTQHFTPLCRLYELCSDCRNFFQPVMRLKQKIRRQRKIVRSYEERPGLPINASWIPGS